MTPVVMWGWIIMGLGGCVNLIARLAGDRVPITRHFHQELGKQIERLMEAHKQAGEKLEDE